MINKKNIITLVAIVTGSFAFAQPTETGVLKNLSVSATVQSGGTSSLEIISSKTIDFGSIAVGSGLGELSNRFTSSEVELSYFVASGINAWDLLIYTTNQGGSIGLINSNGNSIPLKFNIANTSGEFSDIGVDANWNGPAATYSYVTDRGDPNQPASASVSRLTSSAEDQSVGYNPSVKFLFGTELAGAVAGSYSATVTIDLAVQ